MWTNIFKIGGLHQVSWFQFNAHEFDFCTLSDKSAKVDQKEAANEAVLLAHLQLQKEELLSTWTNCFVGPWDPSQGSHNPDEKIKLWLFLPGQHSSIVEKARPAVARLRVLASGVWVAPGDSEEVGAALSQALRNCIERSLKGLSYVRFGDAFSKYHPYTQNEELFRRGQPVAEFVFAATEETIFVHVIISAKHVRALSTGDIGPFFSSSSRSSNDHISVVVSPHGMRGKLTGYCPSDLVKQVYLSSGKFRGSNGIVGLPYHVALGSGLPGQLKAQNCYVEVTLGCHDKVVKNANSHGNFPQSTGIESLAIVRGTQRCSSKLPPRDKMFIYPPEAVLVPVMQTSSTRSSLKRFWLQNWVGPSLSGSSLFMDCLDSENKADSLHEPSGARSQRGYRSSSNSNSSSNGSVSTSSSDSDQKTLGTGDLEADADSLMSRQSGLSSLGQLQNNGPQMGSKRSRAGTSDSFGQAGVVFNPSMSDGGAMENNVSVSGVANEPIGSQWGWDDGDSGIGMDIQSLLSEFGDFGDFFVDDALPFGEPPGSEESQAPPMPPAPEGADFGSSPSNSMMDVSDQMLLSGGFPTFDSFNPPQAPAALEDLAAKNQETTKSSASCQVISTLPSYNAEFDQVVKAEALMSFAPEYGAVDAPKSEISSVIFRSPYVPKSCKVDSASSSNNYVYSATPPSSPCDGSDEKSILPASRKPCAESKEFSFFSNSKKYYTHVERGKHQIGGSSDNFSKGETRIASTQISVFSQSNAKPVSSVANESSLREDNFLSSARTVLSTEIECLVCQASMCRLRHALLSSSVSPASLGGLSGSSTPNQTHVDSSTIIDNVSSKSELKKMEMIPARLAGDVDGAILDGPVSAPVGVWRPGGISKAAKTSTSSMEVSSSIPHNSFIEESMLSYGLRKPLQELLDGIALLVQQATSFVDVALDADYGDGPYGWLALQEQWRRGFSCGPSMVHAGCGGLLASSHSLDIAGTELVDPLAADVQASLTISLLQSDIKAALKSAFRSVDGPLSVIDWCRGRSPSSESGMICDGFSGESTASASECRDSSSAVTLSVGEPMSPSLSTGGAPCIKADGTRGDDTGTSLLELDQQQCSQFRPTLSVIPFPSILLGYQDDWLKTSPSSLELWEKAPFEPYATAKHMSYHVVCPNIDPLTTAAADFFLQLGTVYETCKLGTHAPHILGNEMEIDSGRTSPGFVLLDCPQSMKIDTNNASMLGSISDFFLCLSNGWDLTSYLKTLSKVLKTLKFGSSANVNTKEGNGGPCTVVYVVCPFPEPLAVLQTVVESSVAIGSSIRSSDKERRSMMHNQVAKALSYPANVDESFSNVLTLTGFSIPKLVLQVITVDAIFRVTSPMLNELTVLKEIAFTVYNKARRFSRTSSETTQSLSVSERSHSVMMMASPVTGMWKDCVGARLVGPTLQRESELDSSLRPGAWDNSWQTARTGGLGCDANRTGDVFPLDEVRCLFEPLFILAEPGSLDRGLSPFLGGTVDSSKLLSDDCTSTSFVPSSSGNGDSGPTSQTDSVDIDAFGSGHQKKLPSLHCCYGWTEDWRWMVCIWTDSRGELLDTYVYPFGGVSSRQDTKGLQSLFIQILQQGCQILQSGSPDAKPRDLVITRIGCFFELECQEWQKALYSAGGSDVKKWSLQLRRSLPDGIPASSNGSSLQQQEMSLMQDRALPSPNPLYSPPPKASTYMKGGVGQTSSRKQLMVSHAALDNSKGLLQWVQSISFVSVSIDHSLQLVHQADSTSPGSSQGSAATGLSGYLEGYTPVKSLGSTSASYVLIPSPNMRFMPPSILQLPTCLTADSPPLAHLLHSKGSAIPLSTGFVVSKSVPSMRKDHRSQSKEEWPSVLSVSLVDYYGGNHLSQDKLVKGVNKQQSGRGMASDVKEFEVETHIILESIAAELHSLSWMTVSPAYLERRSALPFHCDMVLRLRRLLHFADKELSRPPEKAQV